MNKKTYKNSINAEDFLIGQLKDKDIAKGFLNESFKTYLVNGDIDEFLYALELVIKSRQSLLSFSKGANLNRSNLYAIFSGKRKPQFSTVLKILSELGYTLKVA